MIVEGQSHVSDAADTLRKKHSPYAIRGQEFSAIQSLELPFDSSADRKADQPSQHDLREAALRGAPVEKVHFFTKQVFVRTADFAYVTDTALQLMRHARLFDNPGGMRITGAGGTGKDAIIRYLKKQRPGVPAGQGRPHPIVPLVVTTFESYLSPLAILQGMHRQLGSAYKEYQNIESLEVNLAGALDCCKTEALVFNEAHHMLNTTRGRERTEARVAGHAGDWLKRFLDKTPLPFFLFGVPGWDSVFELDGQLGTRILNPHTLSLLDERTLLAVLKALDEAIPMPEPAGLTDPTLATAIALVVQGNWRRLMTLLRGALFLAAEAGARRIERQHLSYAYSLHFGVKGNPFGCPEVA